MLDTQVLLVLLQMLDMLDMLEVLGLLQMLGMLQVLVLLQMLGMLQVLVLLVLLEMLHMQLIRDVHITILNQPIKTGTQISQQLLLVVQFSVVTHNGEVIRVVQVAHGGSNKTCDTQILPMYGVFKLHGVGKTMQTYLEPETCLKEITVAG